VPIKVPFWIEKSKPDLPRRRLQTMIASWRRIAGF
jgi:hypothetical protein